MAMANEKQRKTFLSYSRASKDFAVKLAKELKTEGFSVWLDQLDIPAGARWDVEVEKALEESEIFMIIMTPGSISSENVRDEIGYAIDNGKHFLPVLLENCTVPLRLRRFQYVDFTTKSFDDGVESAKELLRNLIAQTTVPRGEIPAEPQDPIAQVDRELAVKAKVKPAPTAATEKEPASRGLVIGIVAVVLLVIAGIGYRALSKIGNNNPSVDNPVTEAPVVSQGKTIVGQWERRSPYQTEHLNFQDDGSYSIEAKSNSTNEIIASDNGTFSYDNNNIYYGAGNKTESYYLDNGGDLLVMDNQVDQAWTRIK